MRFAAKSNTVLLIHGAWLNSRSWDAVKARYEALGFTVVAPDWPYDDRSPEELCAMLHGRPGTRRGRRSSKLAA